MKLVYWCAENLTDSRCYSIRAKTRKEVKDILKDYDPNDYGKPYKVTVMYRNGLDLLRQALGEGGIEFDY